MRPLPLLLIILFIAGGIVGQESSSTKDSKKEASKKKKAEREARMVQQFNETGRLITCRRFVLEANYLVNTMGQRKPVTPVLNFIAVDSAFSLIQVGSNHGIGMNGAGGITAKGKVTNWKLGINEKARNYDVFMTIDSNMGFYDITMSVDYSGYASASMAGLRSGTLQFDGNLVPKDSTRVFKGWTY
ncbi:MAG: DUF4251 domain-containing protein [Bacteroidetes bacterium]|nr:DUF4251 domain-containing protein [Bacteroidota bacterium]